MPLFNVDIYINTNFFGCAVLWFSAESVFLWLIRKQRIRAAAKISSMLSINRTMSHIICQLAYMPGKQQKWPDHTQQL